MRHNLSEGMHIFLTTVIVSVTFLFLFQGVLLYTLPLIFMSIGYYFIVKTLWRRNNVPNAQVRSFQLCGILQLFNCASNTWKDRQLTKLIRSDLTAASPKVTNFLKAFWSLLRFRKHLAIPTFWVVKKEKMGRSSGIIYLVEIDSHLFTTGSHHHRQHHISGKQWARWPKQCRIHQLGQRTWKIP